MFSKILLIMSCVFITQNSFGNTKIAKVGRKTISINGNNYDSTQESLALTQSGVQNPPPGHIMCSAGVISFFNVTACSSWGQSCGLCNSHK